MSGCTAPRNGHRTASGRAACPVHGSRRSYTSSYTPRYAPSTPASARLSGGGSGLSKGNKTTKPRWAAPSSHALYTPAEVMALSPLRQQIEERGASETRKDLFLCHAWDDRKGMAKELYEALTASGVSVWFSEQHLAAGTPMMRAIDKGLAASRAGLVLVTPAMLKRLPAAGVADKELSAGQAPRDGVAV
ncbi:hypothetical protein CIT32_11330 [Micrococcus luteus]|nr:hypothetical protein CIT32_11330 [Micrococcus luteus]